MFYFIGKRAFQSLITLLLLIIAVFFLARLTGDASSVLLPVNADQALVDEFRARNGLDRPLVEQFVTFLGNLLHGDLGTSLRKGQPALDMVLQAYPVTLRLAFTTMFFVVVAAIAVGSLAAHRPGGIFDRAVTISSLTAASAPDFWVAITAILLFSVHLKWFSAGGFPGWEEGILEGLKALLLPAISLAVVQSAILARITRSAVLEVLREDFVRTARAKGVSRTGTLWGHVLRNAMIPVITIMGLQFAELLAGTIVVESVFYLPGLGRLIFQSISNRDLIVVRNCVMLLAAMVVIVNFVVDLLYAAIDPRVKASDI